MAIPFHCKVCDRLLNVNKQHAGRNLKCPNCQSVIRVPDAGETQNSLSPPQQNSQTQPVEKSYPRNEERAKENSSSNPYSIPVNFSPNEPKNPSFSGYPATEIQPTEVEPYFVLASAWTVWLNNFFSCLGVGLILPLIGILFTAFKEYLRRSLPIEPEIIALITTPIQLVGTLLTIFLGIGVTRFYLSIARGYPADFNLIISSRDKFLPIFFAVILAALCVTLGFFFLFIPGIVLVTCFWGFYFVMVDNKVGFLESLRLAYSFCTKNILTSFVLWLVCLWFGILGFFACCIGIYPAGSLVSLIWAVAYLKMTGQQCVR